MSVINPMSDIEIGAVIRKGTSIYEVVDIDNKYIQPLYILEETSNHEQIEENIEGLLGCPWISKPKR
jgi:hypothetical protein